MENKCDISNSEAQKELEKKFHETDFGKFLKIITLVSCILIVVGLLISAYEAIYYMNNSYNDKQQLLFDIGELCMEDGGRLAFLGLLVYGVFLHELVKENKKMLVKIIIFLCIIGLVFNVLYDIGYIIGRCIAIL